MQALDLMAQNGLGERPLLFICHSLGGLVAKQILRKASDAPGDGRNRAIYNNTRAVLFLATPHGGAQWASLLNRLRMFLVFRLNVNLEELREHSAQLRDLYDWYRNQATTSKIQTLTYFETRKVFFLLPPIVNPTSAHPGVGADPVGLDEDHLSIAKPSARDAQVCGAACDLLRRPMCSSLFRTFYPRRRENRPASRASCRQPIPGRHHLSRPLQPAKAEPTRRGTPSPTICAAWTIWNAEPLALTWAGNLLARDDEDPANLASDWKSEGLPKLSDPKQAEHTLKWLFHRSARGLDDPARQALAAAGLLSREPFPIEAITAALGTDPDAKQRAKSALKSLVQHGLLRRTEITDHWQFTHVLGYRFARDEDASDPVLRQRLGRWLHAHLMAALKTGSGETSLSLARALQHAAALLRADPDQKLWQPFAEDLLYDACDRLVDLGRLEWVNPTRRSRNQ